MDVVRIPDLAAGLAVLGLGVWVAALDWRKRLHQSFAVLMLAVAAHFIGLGFTQGTGDPGSMLAAAGLLATPFLALDFALAFQHAYRPEGETARPRPRPFVRGLLLLGAASAVGAFLMAPSLFYDRDGPFGLADHVRSLVLAGLAAVVGNQGLRTPAGQRRDALLIFATGFALHPAYFATQRLLTTIGQPGLETLVGAASLALACAAVLGLLVLGAALVVVTRHADAQARRAAMLMLALVGLAAGSAVAIQPLPDALWLPYFIGLGAAWELAFAGAAAYTVLRYCVFSLDPRFAAIVRQGGTAAGIALAFFLAENTLQDALRGQLPEQALGGTVPALAAAAIAAVAVWPVHRACARLAHRLGPGAEAPRRSREIYRAAYLAASQDGVVTERERRVLERLADALHLASPDVRSIETGQPGARRSLKAGVGDAATGAGQA